MPSGKPAAGPGGAGSFPAPALDARKHRFLVLDGIRGLAIIGVLLTHGSYIIGNRLAYRLFGVGWCGVDLFFVLSGFLITGILIDTKTAVNRASSFYARRILRIFPIYYLTVGVVLILQTRWAWLATAAEMQSWLDRLSYLFYFKDIVPLWHQGNLHETLLSHFWSLAVEEQFYFVWPLIVWHLPAKKVYKLCGISLCFALALRIVLGARFGYTTWMLFFPLTRADGLFAGSALAALLACGYRPSRRILAGLTVGCFLAFLLVALTGYHQFFWGGPYMSTIGFSGLAIGFAVLIAYCLQAGDAPLPRALQAGWLRAFGRYSYGIYVFHLPIFHLADHLAKEHLSVTFPLKGLYSFTYLGLVIAASYGVAWLSFNYFEQSFLRLKTSFEPVFSREPKSLARGPEDFPTGLPSTTY